MKIFEEMTRQDLEELHGLLVEAEKLMAQYREEGMSLGAFAGESEEYCKVLMLELGAFNEIIIRTRRGELYEV